MGSSFWEVSGKITVSRIEINLPKRCCFIQAGRLIGTRLLEKFIWMIKSVLINNHAVSERKELHYIQHITET